MRLATVLHVWLLLPPWSDEVVTLWAIPSSCTVLPPCVTVNPQPVQPLVTAPSVWITMPCGFMLASTSICSSALAFPVAILGSVFQGSLTAESCSRAWSHLLAWVQRPHTCWMDCSTWPIHDLPLASLHPFSSLTALCCCCWFVELSQFVMSVKSNYQANNSHVKLLSKRNQKNYNYCLRICFSCLLMSCDFCNAIIVFHMHNHSDD